MAEIIGVVAGLVSLSIQIVDTAKKLKTRFAAVKGLPETIDKVEQNLEFLSFFLDRVENQNRCRAVAASIDHELILKHCFADYSAICDGLRRLERRLEKMRSRSSFWGLQVRAGGAVVTEMESLDQMERRAHHHITLAMLALLDNKMTASMAQIPALQRESVQDNAPDEQVFPSAEMAISSVLQRPRIAYCAVKHCHCSCHATNTFWAFHYTPLGAILRACDHEGCNARRWQFSMRIQLSRLGIPVSMVVGGEFITGVAGMSIKPVFGCMRRVVKATSAGFRTLARLENGDMDVDEAKETFGQLHRSDPTFQLHVNPQGRTYLQELIRGGPWGEYGHQFDLQLDLLALFVKDFHNTSGINTSEFMLEAAGWGSESAHWAIVDKLVSLGESFDDLDDPLFNEWPEPCVPRLSPFEMYGQPSLEAHDPFYLDFIARIVERNQFFGGTHPLHQAVYQRDGTLVRQWVQKLGPKIDTIRNFLGQTPVHGALAPELCDILNVLLSHAPALVDMADNWGLTPLMYAVALGYTQSASLLIKNGANFTQRSQWKHLDFIGCAFQWDQEDLLWTLLPDIETRSDGSDEHLYVWAQLAEQTITVADWLATPGKEKWISQFWENCLSEPYLDSRLDMVFGESNSALGHLVRTPDTSQRLFDSGFRRHNHRNASGEHCLFSAVKSLNGPLVSLLLAAGTRADIQDNRGRTCLHKLLKKHVGRIVNPRIHEALAAFAIVRLLLESAPQRPVGSITDNCHCPCSENGHIASDQLTAEFEDSIFVHATSPLWLVEYICILEDAGQTEEARESILSQLRLWRFSKLGIPHYRTCRCFGREEEEDRPWDTIKDERKVETLEVEMVELRQLPLSGLKAQLALRMRESYDALKVTRAIEEEERRRARRAKRSGCQKPSDPLPLPNLVIDEDNDQILTSLDLILGNPEFLEDFWDDGLENCSAEPVQILHEYLDYVALDARRQNQCGSDRKYAPIRCRLEWISLILVTMDLPGYSVFFEDWKQARMSGGHESMV
ncbi:hypothetical protein QBC34DRAFT_397718 [Podospora aff. communis PSN243]|uniref:Fungal N-terminal domain-containing protein n=1 Tax=Podospora aff. communis PSN243 TaxID=3040156 RepID=A0AAV9GX43_9PEZI|nr:hypothetical protein QBC34DRAFT_397718 [Podospora aff. communis PSN243]